MDTSRRSHKMAEQILNLTLEIIYLLTGEDYLVVKKTSECMAPSPHPVVSGGWKENRSPNMVPPPPSLIHERHKEQKILELTNKIIQMLSGEVPVRCQDVTVYLSMEEWEYLEGHKDQYKDVLMEDHQPLTAQEGSGKSRSPEKCPCPLYPQDGPGGNPRVPGNQQMDDLIIVKVEETEGDEEYYEADLQYKEEETPTSIGTGAPLSLGCSSLPLFSDSEANLNIAPDIYGQTFITISIPSIIHSGDLLPAPATLIQPPSDQSQVPPLLPRPEGKNQKNNPKNKGRFPCAECGKSFAMRSNFVEHLKVHTAEKPLPCTTCGKRFKRKSDLVRHQKTHTGEKPFLCTECGRCFAIKSNLLAHQTIHAGERPFPCLVCGKRFNRRRSLVRHQRIHTREKS
ncbi:oocyte zinc finger protein XlCOF7.1-like isoform X2 [Bufo bufo]|uniref:oocyte zinc finger protein XlCOF7.1-like isoform X2 n=1 Tax=Bufo bufo TaxID=8384 RepID=UPI001ABE3982|nr:oocyte zinc finger protein XlCOF7.1-like isoform X2 [Bufo bufo]